MSLPILKTSSAASVETLIRYFHQTESKWTAHLSESVLLDVGTAWCNPQLGRVRNANRMLDVALPPGMSPEAAMQLVEGHFAERGAKCHQWVMNPSAPAEQTQPMVEFLRSKGYSQFGGPVMHLDRMPSSPVMQSSVPLRIIPARASFKHAEILHRQASQEWNEPQLTEAGMLHLDDPHYDALLALADGEAAAYVGVLAVGEIGRIDDVFVAEPFRRKRIGTTMMSRALEICARSVFKHVMLSTVEGNAPAISLYEQFGFKRIGECVAYLAPA